MNKPITSYYFELGLVVIAFFVSSCGQSKPAVGTYGNQYETVLDTVDYTEIGSISSGELIVDHDIDLKGRICVLPKGITLRKKDGLIKNGVIVGNETKLRAKGALFDMVTIKGNWNVPDISTKLFVSLKEENSLRNVFALASSKIQNKIVIEKGIYHLVAKHKDASCISICSNTDVVINGTLLLAPNNLENYSIVRVDGYNIRIKGKGIIMGDKLTHTGTSGEWGMGLRFHQAVDCSVSGLTIKNCWGDCIYVGGNSKNILIENCKLDHGRRQGISVTKANGVTIRKCFITNVSGTAPEYAIDIEPNKLDSVDNVLIEDVIARDCEGGVLVYSGKRNGGSSTPWVGNVTIRKCQLYSLRKRPVSVKRCDKIYVERCMLYANKGNVGMALVAANEATIKGNTVNVEGCKIDSFNDMIGNDNDNHAIKIESTVHKLESDNTIIRR